MRDLRHRLLLWFGGGIGAWGINAWMNSLRLTSEWADPAADPLVCRDHGQYLYAIWHEDQLATGWKYGAGDCWAIVSQSRDGDYVERIMGRFGWKTIRGSSTRGGIAVLKRSVELARAPEPFRLALTVDGPRGPRRQVKEGVVYLAAKTGLPIIPIGCGYDRPWRTRSWDRFVLPRPFHSAVVLAGAPIHVPATSSRDQLESLRTLLQDRMEQLSREAERRAGGRSSGALPQIERHAA